MCCSAHNGRSDCYSSFILGYGSSPFPTRTTLKCKWSNWRSPGPQAKSVHARRDLRPRRTERALALSRLFALLSSRNCVSVLEEIFRGSMADLQAPLSTLRNISHGMLRTTLGRCGSYTFLVNDLHHLLLAALPALYVKFLFVRCGPQVLLKTRFRFGQSKHKAGKSFPINTSSESFIPNAITGNIV